MVRTTMDTTIYGAHDNGYDYIWCTRRVSWITFIEYNQREKIGRQYGRDSQNILRMSELEKNELYSYAYIIHLIYIL